MPGPNPQDVPSTTFQVGDDVLCVLLLYVQDDRRAVTTKLATPAACRPVLKCYLGPGPRLAKHAPLSSQSNEASDLVAASQHVRFTASRLLGVSNCRAHCLQRALYGRLVPCGPVRDGMLSCQQETPVAAPWHPSRATMCACDIWPPARGQYCKPPAVWLIQFRRAGL